MELAAMLVFLNRFFHPDYSATSQMLSDVAFTLAQKGHVVAVITSRQRYEAPDDTLPPKEMIGDVAVYRIWTSRFGRANLIGRAIDYATFYASATWRLWRLIKPGDIVVAKTDPPMLSVIVAGICRLRAARLINWLQDIFPETAEVLGVGGRAARVPYAVMRWLRNRSLKSAYMNVVLGHRMAQRVAALGIGSDRVRSIANWADGTVIQSIDPAANALRREWGLGRSFVVGYSGNLGRAHDVDTMLNAMSIVGNASGQVSGADDYSSARVPICWLFIGGGAHFGRVVAEVARRKLTNVVLKPYQPKVRLAESLSASDVHLVSLRPELEGLIVPSKIYGIAAAGRPTIFIGDKDGEIGQLLERHHCGLTVAMGNGDTLAQTILELADEPAVCRRMGEQARKAFESEFDKPIAMAQWEKLVLEISSTAPLPIRAETSHAHDHPSSSDKAR